MQAVILQDRLLGQGQYSSVFAGYFMGRIVAIKCVNTHNFTKASQQEIDILSQIKHPGVIQLFGTQINGIYHFRIFEYMVKGNLNSLIFELKTPISDVLRDSIIKDILSALYYLHQQQILHRDIKPANVVLDKNMQAKFCDFEFAIDLKKELPSNKGLGTPCHLAPEILSGLRSKLNIIPFSTHSDIWAFGILLVVLICRKKAYHHLKLQSIDALYEHVIKQDTQHELPENTPPFLIEMVRGCLARVPEKRPSAAELYTMSAIKTSKSTFQDGKTHLWPHDLNFTGIRRNQIPYASFFSQPRHQTLESATSDPMAERKYGHGQCLLL